MKAMTRMAALGPSTCHTYAMKAAPINEGEEEGARSGWTVKKGRRAR